MASILRTGKFLRYFAGFTRNIVVNTVRETEVGNLLQNTPCICSQFQHGYANNAVPKTDLNLEKQLQRLDKDVRRIGRISRRDIEDVLEEIRTQRSATSSQSLLVIRCCGNLVPEELPEVRTTLVQEIWKTLNALNVPMDISHYNALLRVYLENEHVFSPTEFLAELESKHIEPNRVTYQRLITRYCQQGDIEGATRILEFMREKKLPVNENVFNSLVLGHSQANDVESAKGILSVMKQAGLEPSAETYATLLCAYARHGDVESILSTLAECEQKEIYLLDKDLLDAIYTLTVNGHGDKVDAVLSKLRISTGFNQEAVNIILRLTNKGFEDISLKILRTMPRSKRSDGEQVDVGSFFIKQMVRANRPLEKILSICKTLQDEGLNPKALLIATEAGLNNGIANTSLPLLKEMKNAGLPIRQHYFWPIFCSVESNQIVNILRHMQEEFSLNPNSETLRDYVIPNLKEQNWEKIMTILRDAGISNGIAAASAAYAALNAMKIRDAAKIIKSNRSFYAPALFKQPLIIALAETNDYASFICITRHIHDSIEQRLSYNEKLEESPIAAENEIESDAAHDNLKTQDFVGNLLNEVCSHFRQDTVAVLENLLPALVEEGLSISSANATRISERLGSNMTSNISELLGKLSSGELELKVLEKSDSRKRSIDQLTVEELERFIANVEAKGENSDNIKRHLLNACFRSKNITKTLEVIERLEKEKFNIQPGVWAQLIDLYAQNDKTAEGLELFEKMKAKDDAFKLDNIKTMRLVDSLLKEERFDDALKFLDQNKKPEPFAGGESSFNYTSVIWRALNRLAEAGDAQKLQSLFDALVSGNYILPTNIILGPLIKVHLVKGDVLKAVDNFEQICEKYKSTPWKNELACRLIQMEDAANLQRITDLSTNIHGEINSLYDLVFSFVECGRIRQARKILETPGLRVRPHRIDYACERYKNEGLVEPLEGLVEATKDLNHIDRNKIYYSLLVSYCKSEEAEKALGLWTKMQEEGVTPTESFLTTLAELLQKKNMPIPFVYPENLVSTKTQNIQQQKPKAEKREKPKTNEGKSDDKTNNDVNLYRKAIAQGNIETAVKYKNSLQEQGWSSISDTSSLIEQLVRAERLNEATKYVLELLSDKHYPLPRVFKYFLNKLANSGDIESIKTIGAQLTDDQKKMVSFDNRLCHANIVAGKVDQYMKNLLDEVSVVKTNEEAAELAAKFPRGGALGILEKSPEVLPQFKILAEKYAEFNQLGPINVLWMHLMQSGKEAEAKEIWNQHLSNAPRLMFQRVLQTARQQNDEKLAENVINQLRGSKISEGAIGNAYSCLIDIHNNNKNSEKALDTLKTAVKDVCLENINRTALQRLKEALEAEKKEFPFTIPTKKKSDAASSSSSSSDEDVKPVRPETRPSKPNQST